MPTRPADPATPSACLAALVASDAARPRLTSVRPDERLDLSAATLANWVAKTAHLMRDDLGVAPGDTVGLCLPRHWLAAVWLLAADAVGAQVRVLPAAADGDPAPAAALLGEDADPPVAVLVGPGAGTGDGGPAPGAVVAAIPGCEVLVASLRPFGLPADGPLPPPARDFAEAVRPFPDAPAAAEPDVTLPLLAGGDGPVLTRAEVQQAAHDHAAAAGWASTTRVLGQGPVDAAALVGGLLAPWSVDGSAVWVGNLTPAALVSVAEQERITARA